MSSYKIHKGVGKSVEFKGLKSQYLFLFGGGLLGVILTVFILYVIGVGSLFCLSFGILSAALLVGITFHLNRIYGEHGLMKLSAKKARPCFLTNRKPIRKTIKINPHAK